MPESCLGPICEYVHLLSQWLKIHILPLGPLLTATVATVAGIVAVISILVTKSIARKRAAIDFFLKTDMDKGMVDAHKDFEAALEILKTHKGTMAEFSKLDAYKNIRAYLNIHELVAVGIKNKAFDEQVCYNFWSDALVRHTAGTYALLQYESELEGGEAAFLELRTLSGRWQKRIEAWREEQRKKKAKERKAKGTNAAPTRLLHLLKL